MNYFLNSNKKNFLFENLFLSIFLFTISVLANSLLWKEKHARNTQVDQFVSEKLRNEVRLNKTTNGKINRSVAGSTVMINKIGSSFKGKFVAVEHYGIESNGHSFSRVEIWDMWESKKIMMKEYVSKKQDIDLDEVRAKARLLAKTEALKYKIEI
jgi:hypothetical protein